MKIKAVQVNIWKGKFLDELVSFLKKEDPDIIFMQEVTTGALNFYSDQTADLFEELKSKLGISGVYDCVMKFKQYPDDCFGNAIFSKYPILRSNVLVLKQSEPLDYDEKSKGDFAVDRPYVPRNLMDAVLDIEGIEVHAICVHGAWTAPPTDSDETVGQAEKIAAYVKSLGDAPFVMGGDFNMPPGTKVIDIISGVAGNLMLDLGIAQTLNPRIHFLKDKGFLVDYIFCSKHLKADSVEVPQVDVSDHLPVVAKLDFSTQ